MTERKFYLNGVEINPPANWQELSIKVDYKDGLFNTVTNTQERVFFGAEATAINGWINDGFIFEGISYRETLTDGITEVEIVNGLLDLTTANPISCDEIRVDIIESRIDWFRENSNFTFEFLLEKVQFKHPNFKFISVPYVISSVPDYANIGITLFAGSFVVIETINLVYEIIDKVANIAAFEWGEFIALFFLLAKLLLLIVAIVNLIKTLRDLIVQPVKYHTGMQVQDMLITGFAYLGYEFKSTIFDDDRLAGLTLLPAKYNVPKNTDNRNNLFLSFLGIDANVLFGYTNEADIFANSTGYYEGTFYQLVEEIKLLFNGKLIFEAAPSAGANPVARIERRDYRPSENLYQLPDIYNDEHTTNATEINSNFYLTFATDTTDNNTVNDYYGTALTEIISPSAIRMDKRNLILKNRKEVRLPFALGKRKETLTDAEKILDSVFKRIGVPLTLLTIYYNIAGLAFGEAIANIVKTVNTVFGTNIQLGVSKDPFPTLEVVNMTDIIGTRKGMLMLEQDSTSVQKLLLLDTKAVIEPPADDDNTNGLAVVVEGLFSMVGLGYADTGTDAAGNRLKSYNKSVLSAQHIYNNYYIIDSFVGSVSYHNQYIIRNFDKIYFSFKDLPKILNYKYLTDANGKVGEVEEFEWNEATDTAKVRYRINERYTDKLISTLIIQSGAVRI